MNQTYTAPLFDIPNAIIPINLEAVKHHKKDYFIFLTHCAFSTVEIDWTNQYFRCGDILTVSTRRVADITGSTLETIRKYRTGYQSFRGEKGSIIPILKGTWLRFNEAIKGFSSAEKNGLWRLFSYFICQCWTFQDFSRNQHQIAADLGMKVADVGRRSQVLLSLGFIALKHGCMHIAGMPYRPQVYMLYEDDVPSYYAKTEWFAGQLAHRSYELDSLLDEYKNVF